MHETQVMPVPAAEAGPIGVDQFGTATQGTEAPGSLETLPDAEAEAVRKIFDDLVANIEEDTPQEVIDEELEAHANEKRGRWDNNEIGKDD